MKEKLFVYGTLRFPKYQREAWGKTFESNQAVVPNHRRSDVMVHEDRYIVAWPDKSHSVRGVVLRVTPSDLKISDKYEDRYNRRKVTLTDGTTAWMYQYKYKL